MLFLLVQGLLPLRAGHIHMVAAHCPHSSIFSNLLILPPSAALFASLPYSSTPSCPVYFMYQHFLSAALHSVSPHHYHPQIALLVVQSRPFTNHAKATAGNLYIPPSICSWHSCITFSPLSPSPSAFPLLSFSLLTHLHSSTLIFFLI